MFGKRNLEEQSDIEYGTKATEQPTYLRKYF